MFVRAFGALGFRLTGIEFRVYGFGHSSSNPNLTVALSQVQRPNLFSLSLCVCELFTLKVRRRSSILVFVVKPGFWVHSAHPMQISKV